MHKKNVPNSICWNITNKCNDACKFCYRDKESKDLSYEDQIKVINNLEVAGIKKLTFAGGEPLLAPHILELIKYAKSKGFITSLTTNGILITDELLFELDGYLDWITFSLDAPDEKNQTKMSRNEKHVERTMAIIKKIHLYKLGFNLKINTLVSNINKNVVFDLIEFIKVFKISRWKLFQFVELRGDSKENELLFSISDEEFNEIASRIVKEANDTSCIVSISDRENIESAYFVIFPNGDIKISTNLQDKILGNVLTHNIKDIWNNSSFKLDLHEARTNFIKI